MESPRSAKRRKLETIPESPLRTRSAEKSAASKRKLLGTRTHGATTGKEESKDVYDDIEGANGAATPSRHGQSALSRALSRAPSKPATPKPVPSSANKSQGGNLSGLMKRFNQKLAEHEELRNSPSPQKKPPTPGPLRNGAPDQDSASQLGKTAKVNTSDKRSTFEEDQLERAAKRKPKKTLEDTMREIEEASRREVQDDAGKARNLSSALKAAASPAVSAKKKPGRPPKTHPDPVELEDEGPPSPSKLASARKGQHRALSPMMLDLPASRPHLTPKKALSSPAKPRPRPMQDLDIKPQPTNFSKDLSISTTDLRSIQSCVLQQLNGRKHTPFVGLDDEYAKIANLIHQTIVAGESNSILVIGARGSGKSAVVESILSEQQHLNADLFHVVRLNGFIHTDDKIALRDIWRQLGREMDLEDDAAGRNAADTLTTLLALLSHPTELGRSGDEVTKSVIFILDEFDLFATHPRQTLLYNLFDIAQSRKAPIAVLGLTTRFDVAEQLEKRVKSRFSHRHVHLSLAKDLSSFRRMCQGVLTPRQTEEMTDEGRKAWEAVLNDLFTLDSFNTHLRRIYYISKSVPEFCTSMLVPISTITLPFTNVSDDGNDHENTPAANLLSHLSDTMALTALQPPDTKLELLPSLSQLQLALLISAARLTIIHSTDTVTFALTYAEYVNLASKAKIAASAAGVGMSVAGGIGRVWSKEVSKGAWEGLVAMEMVIEEGGRGKDGCRVDIALEEIGMADGVELGSVMGKWCREI